MAYSAEAERAWDATHRDPEESNSQARFIGVLAMVLAVLLILSAIVVASQAIFSGGGVTGSSHVDQAGSSDPSALPQAQNAKPSEVNPKAAPSPAPAQMPVKNGNAPAAAANQQ